MLKNTVPVHEKVSQILPRESAIVKIEDEKVAAYRDETGALHTLDPFYRHMRCIVSGNNAENTWDCPCRGSRYNANGDVIKSPAAYGFPEKKVNTKINK
ncbi:MAG: Rieske 2Fe-2S domain-containing protein [Methanosarcina vacuolata]|jgi:Rieske Fe-S protein|nr:Rieske 2Fe-2S domain-containing protein [Methanosarcina vacuolata]